MRALALGGLLALLAGAARAEKPTHTASPPAAGAQPTGTAVDTTEGAKPVDPPAAGKQPGSTAAEVGQAAPAAAPSTAGEPPGSTGAGASPASAAADATKAAAPSSFLATTPARTSRRAARFSGRARSELYFAAEPRVRPLGDGRYMSVPDRMVPFYQTLELSAEEVEHPGLSVRFQGWAGVDLDEVHFSNRLVTDLTYLYVQMRTQGVDARLGRQMVFAGPTRGLSLDGLSASYASPLHLGVHLFGGLVVSPALGPEWYRQVPGSLDVRDFAPGFSRWEREGDYAVGGRVFYSRPGRASAGVSILHSTRLNEVDHQLVGADLDLVPVSWLGITANAALDLRAVALQEADVLVDIQPMRRMEVELDYRHANPTLFLSGLSIFSVFSNEEYDSVGGTLRATPLSWLRLQGGYHHRFYGHFVGPVAGAHQIARATGYDLRIGAAAAFARAATVPGTVRLDYGWLTQGEQGLHSLRLAGVVPLVVPGLRVAMNLYLDVFDGPWNAGVTDPQAPAGAASGAPYQRLGLLGNLGLYYSRGANEAGAYVTVGSTPHARHEVSGMVTYSRTFDVRFSQRSKP